MLFLWEKKKSLKKLSDSINCREVMDHGHCTGKYRSAAHINCKLKFNLPNEIAVFFRNGSNYDYQFIIKEVFPFQ